MLLIEHDLRIECGLVRHLSPKRHVLTAALGQLCELYELAHTRTVWIWILLDDLHIRIDRRRLIVRRLEAQMIVRARPSIIIVEMSASRQQYEVPSKNHVMVTFFDGDCGF
jgi:hypothetical protein